MKSILLVANKLESGGVEVSLVNFINKLLNENNDIKISLLLLKAEGVYLDDLKDKCEILEIPFKNNIYRDFTLGVPLKIKNTKNIIDKIRLLTIKILRKFNITLYYNFLLFVTPKIYKKYDLAIDFYGYGYFGSSYITKKIDSKKKALFIHSENIEYNKYVNPWLNLFDSIFCVSNSCAEIFNLEYPNLKDKVDVFHNIIDKKKLFHKAEEHLDIQMDNNQCNLVTIGRLEYEKGYDLILKISKELVKQNYNFKWYLIGDGSQREILKQEIEKNNLNDYVFLLGMKKNPYIYLSRCDIYVQPSRIEGYGIAIAEARAFNKPIVASKIKCIEEQIENKKTGILCEFDQSVFTNVLKKLIDNKVLREELSINLIKNNCKNIDEMYKIYNLLK